MTPNSLHSEGADDHGWMDIRTAPPTEFILLHCSEDDSIWFAKWQDDVWHGIDELGLTREGHSAGDPRFVTGWFVERWQPLPKPPITPSERYGKEGGGEG